VAGTSDNTILLNRQQSVVQCTVADLSSRTYFFESSVSPNIIWVKLDKLDFTKTQKLDLTLNSDRVGDVTAEFKVTEPFVTLAPDDEK
jgi:penicillin V acylase-like amidase (Ntn superfamily)